MSLRAKLLALFAVFGALPVVALGVYGYVRSLESVEDLILERTAAVTARIADEIQSRYALRLSDMLLFADNAETLRLYQTHAAGDSAGYAAARVAADAFLRQAWDVVGSSYRAVALRDCGDSNELVVSICRRDQGAVTTGTVPLGVTHHSLLAAKPAPSQGQAHRLGAQGGIAAVKR
jgi:hypothetical protein